MDESVSKFYTLFQSLLESRVIEIACIVKISKFTSNLEIYVRVVEGFGDRKQKGWVRGAVVCFGDGDWVWEDH